MFTWRKIRLLVTILLTWIWGVSIALSAPEPVRVPSFGPNGTHWPSLIPTPFMYDETVPNQITVDADWGQIEDALEAVTDAQANAGVLILVRPGTLTGNGIGGAYQTTLKSLGSSDWEKRVTVCPRDGFGTVAMNQTELAYLNNICFAGFTMNSLYLEGCNQCAIAWVEFSGWLGVYGDDGIVSSSMEFSEVVMQDLRVANSDASDVFSSGGDLTNWLWDGCYFTPRYLPVPLADPLPHTDTLQFASPGGGSYGDFHLRDSAFFASDNTALQTGGVIGMILEHSLVVAGSASLARYPVPSGADDASGASSINGAGENMQAIDSIIIGPIRMNTVIADRPWSFVSNTLVSASATGLLEPLEGSWTLDTSLDQNIDGYPVYPSDAFLESIWSEDAVQNLVSAPVMTPTGGQYETAQNVTITAETGAVIYYTTDGSDPTTSSTEYTGAISVSSSLELRAIATFDGNTSAVRTISYTIGSQVATPVISPASGDFLLSQEVSISTTTADALLYYTIDGSSPLTSTTRILYTDPFDIDTTTTVLAAGIKAGSDDSFIQESAMSFEPLISANNWINVSIVDSEGPKTGIFRIRWCATPVADNIDSVTGISSDIVSDYSDLACIVRFSPAGFIDVRDGGGYRADNVLNYTAGVKYEFYLTIDVTNKTYTVAVLANDEIIELARDYEFRTDQIGVTSLSNFAFVTLGVGSHTVDSLFVDELRVLLPPTNIQIILD
ncbi:MAG: chitobiase/beta-hexosaminidase C-terminal domain-containing protein [Akkermansiaceae bacterium]